MKTDVDFKCSVNLIQAINSLGRYAKDTGCARFHVDDPRVDAAVGYVEVAASSAGLAEDAAAETAKMLVESRADNFNYRGFGKLVRAAIVEGCVRAGKTGVLGEYDQAVMATQATRIGDYLLEYIRRYGQDHDFTDDVIEDLENGIINAVRVMAKRGLRHDEIARRIKDYMGKDAAVLSDSLLSRFIREGVNEHLEAVFRESRAI